MTSKDQLLPCPFCGSEDVFPNVGKNGNGSDWHYIQCESCEASAEPDIWNRRAKVDAAQVRNDALEEAALAADKAGTPMDGSNSEVVEVIRALKSAPVAAMLTEKAQPQPEYIFPFREE